MRISAARVSTPSDAYRFAKGEEVEVGGEKHRISAPLDWAAVTDHAEYLGEMYSTMNEGAPGHDQPQLVELRGLQGLEEREAWFLEYVVKNNRGTKPQHAPFYAGEQTEVSGWKQVLAAAEEHYAPGTFTTIPAFEWSAAPQGANLHRNVFFRDMNVPQRPMSYVDINREEGLWAWLAELEQQGIRAIAIPHNSNASKGMMFAANDSAGEPIDLEYAAMRSRFEPLIEIMQIKGNSEVHRNFWSADEFAGFENADSLEDYSGRTIAKENFVRWGLAKGLAHQKTLGTNPYHYGIVGGTDNHNGTPSNVAEDNFARGSHGAADATVERRRTAEIGGWLKGKDLNPGALTGVWATQNTREAIWDALKARETYATSGPRIKVRFFGRMGTAADALPDANRMIEDGYAHGVPMGGTLEGGRGVPRFRVWAAKGPDRRQPRSHPDHQGLGRCGWRATGPGVRRGVVRRSRTGCGRQAAGGGQHRRSRPGHLHQHDRQRGVDRELDRSAVRSTAGCGVLRPGIADPDATLEHLRRGTCGFAAAGGRRGYRAGARLDLTDLVYAEGLNEG